MDHNLNPNHNRRLNRDQNRVMLLIDADNVSADVIVQAFERVMAEQRAIHVRRAYCTAELAAKHLKLFKALSIRPIVNVSTGKNSTDIALAVDAIDLVISERPDVVVLVSSDSDFAPLVIRLREKGCRVEGIGQEGKTADDSKLVYDRFVDIEHRRATPTTSRSRSKATEEIKLSPERTAAVAAKKTAAKALESQIPTKPRKTASRHSQDVSQPPQPTPAEDWKRIIDALPELGGGEPVRLALVAERLRTVGLLSKTAPSTKLFKKYPDLFLLTPERQPHTVQFRVASGGG